LSLGQLIVGLIKGFETINAVTRITYIALMMVVCLVHFLENKQLKKVVRFSPYGCVKMMLAAGMEPARWTSDTTIAVLISFGYIIVLAGIGIKKF